jgi:hypothetical protein
MALDANIRGVTTGLGAEVNASNQLKVVLETDSATNPSNVGNVIFVSENDNGSITGTPKLHSPETSGDYRLRVGVDSVWDEEAFNYVVQNQNKHKILVNTLTITYASGFLNTNGLGVTTTATGVQFQTYRHFALQGAGAIYVEAAMALSNAPVTNWNLDFGLFLPAAASTSIPLDGVYFRFNSAGLVGVLNNNGTETTTSALAFAPVVNQVYKYNITITTTDVEFWIDDTLYATVTRPIGTGSTFYGGAAPFALRHHHTGVTSGVIQAKFANYAIGYADMDNVRLWASNKAGQGLSGVNYPSGTAGATSNATLNAAPASSTLTASTAPAINRLGGDFLFPAPAGSESDYPIFAFLNPAPTTGITGRNLVVRGVWIDTWNQVVAVGATPTIMQWTVAVGSTATTLATTDGAVSRLPKRNAIGVQYFPAAAAIGFLGNRIDANYDAPLVVEPGCVFHVILKVPVGLATATETFRGVIGVNAYWE